MHLTILTLIIGLHVVHASVASEGTTARGIDRVAPAAQQLWAEAIVTGWPESSMRADDAALRDTLSGAIEVSGYPPPLFVYLAELDLDSERHTAIIKLQSDLLRAWAASSSAGTPQADPTGEILKDRLPQLLARSTEASERWLLLALKHDPGYLPALQQLAWSDSPDSRRYALQSWQQVDPENAFPWYIQAAFELEEKRFESALCLIERGSRCARLQEYPVELPTQFTLSFPDNAFTAEVSKRFKETPLAGRPVTPVILSNLRTLIQESQSFFRPALSHSARTFRRQAQEEIEAAKGRGDVVRVRRLQTAVRRMGRHLVTQLPQDGLAIVFGIYLVRSASEFDADCLNSPPSKAVIAACDRLAVAWRSRLAEINPRRAGETGLPMWLTGEVDHRASLHEAAVLAVAESQFLETLDREFPMQAHSCPDCCVPAGVADCLPATTTPRRVQRRSRSACRCFRWAVR